MRATADRIVVARQLVGDLFAHGLHRIIGNPAGEIAVCVAMNLPPGGSAILAVTPAAASAREFT